MKNLKKITIYTSILLILFLFLILFKGPMLSADQQLFALINGMSNPVLDAIFIPMTYYGSIFFWLFMIFLTWIKRERKLSLYLIFAFLLDSFLSPTLKWIFNRDRPDGFARYFFLSDIDAGKSFPSGHSQKAFSGAAILSSSYRYKHVFYLLAILTAISRVYIGAHYPLDVLFGSLIGLIVGNMAMDIPTKSIEKNIEKLVKRLGFKD